MSSSRNAQAKLTACPDCDLLLQDDLPRDVVAVCPRCGADLHGHGHGDALERALAFSLAAAIFLTIANAFPVVALQIEEQTLSTTLLGAVRTLWQQDMHLLSLLVLFTTLLMPALQLGALIWLLLPLRLGRRPAGFTRIYRLAHAVHPWVMVEVFVLGVLVALVKLAHLAQVEPGIGLWAYGALMLLIAAAMASFDPYLLWQRWQAAEA